MDKLADVVGATVDLTTHTVQVNTVLHREIYAEVVVLITCQTTLTRAEAYCLHGFQAAEPSEYVDVMHMLLDDMVAREPFPVHPVLDHVFAIVPASLTLAIPQHVLVPVNDTTGDLANQTLHDLFVGLHIAALVVTLRTGYDAEVLRLSLLCRGHDRTIAYRIDADRFLQEGMFALLGCVLEMNRTEEGRSSHNNHIYPTVDDLFISLHADEAMVGRHVDALLVFQFLGQIIHTLLEGIAQGCDRYAIGCVQEVEGGT